MRPLLRTNVHVAIGYVVAGSVLWLVVRRADWHMLVAGARSVDWSLLGAAIVVRFAALALSALRWQALLVPVRRVPLGSVIAATMVGMTVTTLVSAQAAEVARPLWLIASAHTELGATLATVAVEWCLDLWAVLMLNAWLDEYR